MRYGSVCSGIEAATAAWHPLSWRPAFFSEIEPFPCAVLAHHYPHVPNHGDMTKFEEWPDADLDVLVGGTPCQSFSVAGLRKGLSDPRGNLMLTFGAIAQRYRPTWLVWENVPGVLSSNGGRDFGTFLGMLGELGYGFAYRVLDAQFFGVAQRRRRVFVVGCLGDWRRAAAVLFERDSLSGNPAPSRKTREGSAKGAICGPDGDCWPAKIAPTLNAHFGEKQGLENQHINGGCGLFVAHSLRGEGFDASEDGTGRGTPLVPVAFSCKDHGADAGELAPTLRSMNHDGSHANGGGQVAVAFGWQNSPSQGDGVSFDFVGTLDKSKTPAVAFAQNSRDELREMPYVGALAADPGMKQQSFIREATAVRRLTPRECERLQGFRDDFTLIPVRGKPAADGPRYKALGNSMAVPVMRWIGERIRQVTEIRAEVAA